MDEFGVYGRAGESFFHYTRADVAFDHIVPSGRLRLSPFREMRDPIENKDWIRVAGYSGSSNHEGHIEEAFEVAGRLTDTTKLLSLTLDSPLDDGQEQVWEACYARGYARPRMWEQYSVAHAGVCLVFERRSFHEAVTAALSRLGKTFDGPVVYSNAAFSSYSTTRALLVNDICRLGRGDLRLGMQLHVERHVSELFFTKLEEWQSEHEYRYLVFAESDSPAFVAYGEALQAVLVGERYPPAGLRRAQEACARAGAELGQIRWGAYPPEVFDPFEGPRSPAAMYMGEL